MPVVVRVLAQIIGSLVTVVSLALDVKAVWNWHWNYVAIGGFVLFLGAAIWQQIDAELRIRRLMNSQPDLYLGEPQVYPNETVNEGGKQRSVKLYRIPVRNRRAETNSVSVKLVIVTLLCLVVCLP